MTRQVSRGLSDHMTRRFVRTRDHIEVYRTGILSHRTGGQVIRRMIRNQANRTAAQDGMAATGTTQAGG